MTREEAVDYIKEWLKDEYALNTKDRIVLTMAIEALSSADQPTGEWIDKGDYAECSNCGRNSGTQFDGVQPIPRKTKFCPHCGAKMFKGGEKE